MPQPPAAGRLVQIRLVRLDQPLFLFRADAGEGVIGRVAKHHEDFFVALDVLGRVAFLREFGPLQELLLGAFRRFPAR